MAVLDDGRVFAWGANGAGQLGLGDQTDRPLPTYVTSLADVEDVRCDLYCVARCLRCGMPAFVWWVGVPHGSQLSPLALGIFDMMCRGWDREGGRTRLETCRRRRGTGNVRFLIVSTHPRQPW